MYTNVDRLKVVGWVLAAALVASLFLQSSGLLAFMILMLAGWAFWYLKQMEGVSEEDITRRIRAEYPAESRPQVLEVYKHLKAKELDGLFGKILDESKGDVKRVIKLADVAENVGWQAFLNNHY